LLFAVIKPQTMPSRKKILFVCTGNSCRSQMAEAWTRKLHPEQFETHSAGTDPGRLDPRAVRVMREVGIDISKQRSKHFEDLAAVTFDWVITVCDNVREVCPVVPGAAHQLHAGFDDPPRIAAGAATEDDALAPYRRVRDEMRDYVTRLPEILGARPREEGKA
jgi:arsenate reductase (thioredoxin)